MKKKKKPEQMNMLHLIWIIPVAVLFSPIGSIVAYAITESHLSWLLVMFGLCLIAAGGADDGYD